MQYTQHEEGPVDMFSTPLSFTIPSFLLGMAVSFDIGSSLHGRIYRRYMTEPAEEADRRALLSDFVVVGGDMNEACALFEATHEDELSD